MNTLTVRDRLLAFCLAALAGFVDAVGFVELGGFFVSFMSGNTTRAAVGLAQHSADSGRALSLIAAFVVGSAAGSLLGHAAGARRRPAVMLAVGVLLAIAATLGAARPTQIATLAMALAMGAENAIFESASDVRVGLTYMTGTLVKLGQRIALAMRGGDRFGWIAFLLQWLGLAAGAILGAMLDPRLGLTALWFPVAAAALLTVAFWRQGPKPA